MSLSLHQASVPVFDQILNGLTTVLDKANAHCEARKIDPGVLLQMRLSPDMFHMARQIWAATDHAGGAVARLAGIEVPKLANEDSSFDDLKRRIAKTLDFVHGVEPAKMDAGEGKPVELVLPSRTISFASGRIFLLHFAMPQFMFHATTGYDILRHAGVEIGKRDFLGKIPD